MRYACLFALLLPSMAQETPKDDFPERVSNSIERGRAWLVARQDKDGAFPGVYVKFPGSHALALWTLLESGLPTQSEAVQKTLAYVRSHGDPTPDMDITANYGASLALVALQSYYFHKVAEEDKPRDAKSALEAVRKRLTKEDRDLASRCLGFVRSCASGERWNYTPLGKAKSKLKEARISLDVAPFDPGKIDTKVALKPVAWKGDNSNAQYGWMGIRAASLLGVSLDDDDFVKGELERLIGTRQSGEKIGLTIERNGKTGFSALWPASEIKAEVAPAAWAYQSEGALPTMTTGCIASLIYAWQEAEERGLMTDLLRARARDAILGGIADLFVVTKKDVRRG